MYITSCTDEELKKRMLECNQPTPQLLEEIIQHYEQVQADASGTREAAREAVINGGNSKHCRQTNESKNKLPNNKLAILDGKYYRWGFTTHRPKECKIDRSIPCRNCSIKGHLTVICQSASVAQTSQPNQQNFSQPNSPSCG